MTKNAFRASSSAASGFVPTDSNNANESEFTNRSMKSSGILPRRLLTTSKNSTNSSASESSISSSSISIVGGDTSSTVGFTALISCCCCFLSTIISLSSSEPKRSENLSNKVPTSPVAILSMCPYILSFESVPMTGSDNRLFSH